MYQHADWDKSTYIKQNKNKAKVHATDRIKRNKQKTTLGVLRPQVSIRVNKTEVVSSKQTKKLGCVSLTLKHWAIHYQHLPHIRWRKFLAWDDQIKPVNFRDRVPLATGQQNPAVYHKPPVDVSHQVS
jgi:hypothetical protein